MYVGICNKELIKNRNLEKIFLFCQVGHRLYINFTLKVDISKMIWVRTPTIGIYNAVSYQLN
jgi:hypothetical protein